MRKLHILMLIGAIILFAAIFCVRAEENETNQTGTAGNITACFNDTDCNDFNNLTFDSCVNETCQYQAIECLTDADCNDSNISTIDLCIDGSCSYELNETNETNEIPECALDSDCDDGNNLTIDKCEDNKCIHEKLECIVDADCDDENISTIDLCENNSCICELNETGNQTIGNFSIALPKFAVTSASYFFRMFTLGLHGYLPFGSIYGARILLNPFQSGNRNGISGSYTANIGFFGNTAPYPTVTINSYSVYPNLAPNGSIIRFSISATNAEAVWANITLPDSSIVRIDLINDGDAYYTANQIGTYDVVFYANSSLGLLASAIEIDFFEIYAPIPYVPGGGGAVECTYDWRCSPWNACINGKQTRTCVNLGACTGTKGKPEETKECLGILFDIAIKLESIEMTEDEYLAFNVTLIEKNSVEKVDVQVKYTILDKNRNEIFSQIETKAVEKELTYRKIIDDVKLVPGEYSIRVEVFYGDAQKASAEQKFMVQKFTVSGKLIITKKEFPWMEILTVLAALAAIALLIAMLRRKHHRRIKDNRLSHQTGKDVYTDDGKMLGKVAEIYIEGGKIYGWLIKASQELQKDIKKEYLLIRHKHVKSVGEAIVVDGRIIEYLGERFINNLILCIL